MSKIKFSLTTFAVIIATFFGVATAATTLFPSVANADETYNQCNQYYGQYANNTTEWQANLAFNHATSEAESEVFVKSGFRSIDQTLNQWMSARVETGSVIDSFSGMDYGCEGVTGDVFEAGIHGYAAGKQVFYVLPSKYTKSEVSSTRSKTYSVSTVLKVQVIGLQQCSNPFGNAWAYVRVYIKAPVKKAPPKKAPPKKHKKPVKKAPPKKTTTTATASVSCPTGSSKNSAGVCVAAATAASCPSGETTDSNGNCVNQTPVATSTCGNGQVMSTSGCITISVANNCGTTVIGNDNTITTGGDCTSGSTTPPTPTETVSISGLTDENQIPTGKNSGCISVTVYASAAGATLTIDPGIGSVSSCTSTTGQAVFTSAPLNAGTNTVSFVLYAPSDVDSPTQMTVNYTASLGSVQALESDVFDITYSTRPS